MRAATDRVRWGIIGSAKITEVGLGPAIQADPRSQIVAVGSRGAESAERSAKALGAARAHGSYEALLADPEIDIVYNPLPNSMHHEWTLKALAAGKHVLCEKPMGMTEAEVQEMATAARDSDLLLLEGFMWRFHPRVNFVQQLIADEIGPAQLIRALYTFELGAATDVRSGGVESDIRMTKELGGGALGDVGSYCVNGLRTYAGSSPVRVTSSRHTIEGDLETRVAAQIDFANGVVGQMYAAIDIPGGGHVEIVGARGKIRIPNAFRTREEQGDLIIEIVDAAGNQRTETLPFIDQYKLEVEHIAKVLLDGETPLIPIDDSIANARTIDAIRRSWHDGTVELD